VQYQEIHCPYCNSTDVRPYGKTSTGKQRYFCKNSECSHKTFLLEYSRVGDKPGIKMQILNMAMNGSGTRDTARVLGISANTVTRTLRKLDSFVRPVNEEYLKKIKNPNVDVVVCNPLIPATIPFNGDKTLKKTKKHRSRNGRNVELLR